MLKYLNINSSNISNIKIKKYNPKGQPSKNINYYRIKRRELISLMGDKCVKCSFTDWRALQVDHINGGGLKEIKLYQNKNINLYYAKVKASVIAQKQEYQLICANCNWIKRHENNENPNLS